MKLGIAGTVAIVCVAMLGCPPNPNPIPSDADASPSFDVSFEARPDVDPNRTCSKVCANFRRANCLEGRDNCEPVCEKATVKSHPITDLDTTCLARPETTTQAAIRACGASCTTRDLP